MSKLDYVIMDLLESTARNIKAHPLNLGGVAGAGGGAGAPPGGFIGWLPQTRVAYDFTEDAYSGVITNSGAGTLVDNLAHLRYRLNIIESGASIWVMDANTGTTYRDVDTIKFSGGTIITDLGNGDLLVRVSGGTSGGTALTVKDVTNTPTITNVDTIVFSGATVTNLGSGDVLVAFSGQQTSPLVVKHISNSPTISNVDTIVISGATVTNLGSGDVLIAISGGTTSNSFGTIVVSGQANVVADQTNDSLTFIAGSGISITTDSINDSVVITNTNAVSTGQILYITNTASDLMEGGIFFMRALDYSKDLTSGTQSGSLGSIGTGESSFLVAASAPFVPSIQTISKGTFRFYITANQTGGTRSVVLRAKVYKEDTGLTQTLLCTSNDSAVLTSSSVMYELITGTVGPFTLSSTDRLVIKFYAVGGAAGTNATIGYQFCNTDGERVELPTGILTPSKQVLFTHGNNASVPASTTDYLNPTNFGLTTAVSNVSFPVPATMRLLTVTTNSTQPASGSLVFTVLKNNVATGVTITVPANQAAGTFQDTTHSVAIAATDQITYEVKNNATAASALIIRVSGLYEYAT